MTRYIRMMPVCVSCGNWGAAPLCLSCRTRLGPGGVLSIDGIPIAYATHHSGTGRALVHGLKYRGVVGAADVLAMVMAPLAVAATKGRPAVLVPIPRSGLRRVFYGVDPAWELALRIGRLGRIRVARSLQAPFWWPRNAGAAPTGRTEPGFRERNAVGAGYSTVILVDDVITTGSTLRGAVAAIGCASTVELRAIAATSPGLPSIPGQLSIPGSDEARYA